MNAPPDEAPENADFALGRIPSDSSWCSSGMHSDRIRPRRLRHEKARIDRLGMAWAKGRNGSRQSWFRQVF